jgi:hypothetical protein
MATATCAPFFHVWHKPWFQVKEGHELDQCIRMFFLECNEELHLHCNGFQDSIACEHLKIINKVSTTFMSFYSLIKNKYQTFISNVFCTRMHHLKHVKKINELLT